MATLIRNLGNFGSLQKLDRIIKGIEVAKRYQCSLVIALDPIVYGKNAKIYSYEELRNAEINFNKDELFVGKDTYPWWDIVRVNVLF